MSKGTCRRWATGLILGALVCISLALGTARLGSPVVKPLLLRDGRSSVNFMAVGAHPRQLILQLSAHKDKAIVPYISWALSRSGNVVQQGAFGGVIDPPMTRKTRIHFAQIERPNCFAIYQFSIDAAQGANLLSDLHPELMVSVSNVDDHQMVALLLMEVGFSILLAVAGFCMGIASFLLPASRLGENNSV
jgi:hypothetical protein